MDKTFQTSFIPKKPSVEPTVVKEKFTLGIFGFIGVLIFVITTALAVGVYFYEKNLIQELADKQAQLNTASDAIEFPLIDAAKTLGRRITDANQILANHVIVSPIFEALQMNTLKSVQFDHFTYTTPTDQSGQVTVAMTGVARDYTSIALESDQLAKNKDIQNPIFSGLSLDPQTGNVSFTLNFTVSSDLVSFEKHVSDYAVTPPVTASSSTEALQVPDQTSGSSTAAISTPAIINTATSTTATSTAVQSSTNTTGVSQ